MGKEEEVMAVLRELADERHRRFLVGLVPNVDQDRILGVKTGPIDRLARKLVGHAAAEAFLSNLPHRYLEEYMLHCAILNLSDDFDYALGHTLRLLPYVDNWAVCDKLSPAVFGKCKALLLPSIRQWLLSGKEFTVRFAMEMLMKHFLDDDFRPEYLDMVVGGVTDAYYVRMMAAWYFATALAKQYDDTLPYIECERLDAWTHNKAIQKAVESLRVSDDRKTYLRTLKIGKKPERRGA